MAGKTILIVDDSPANLKLTRATLDGHGYELRTAASAEQALESIAVARPHLIVLDIQLPGMDGLALARRLKGDPATEDILIAILTAHVSLTDEGHAAAAGCDCFLRKPIDTRTLPAVVASMLAAPAAPAAARQTRRTARALSAADPATPEWDREPRILVVDDDVANVRMLERVLARAGITAVESCTDPREAVARFRAGAPDLVVLDLHMPGVDGFEVLAMLQCLIPPHDFLPVLVLTGDDNVSSRQRALGMGATDFLAKPFDVLEVVLRIRNLLETRRLHLVLQRQNVALEAAIGRRTAELEEARHEMLHRLALAGDLRDHGTKLHSHRVGYLAAELARALGLAEGAVELMRRTAPLHDIGKLGVPDTILLKPGPLTPDETTIMRAHTTTGARILSGGHSAFLQMAEQIAHYHHEWWDGTGYPEGLAGAAIPLAARIVAVADVVDALSSDRPYRPALAPVQVLTTILAGSGTHFDPRIVAALGAVDWMGVLSADPRVDPPSAAPTASWDDYLMLSRDRRISARRRPTPTQNGSATTWYFISEDT